MSDWNRKAIGPESLAAGVPPRRPRYLSHALARGCGAIGFSAAGAGVLSLGQYLFGLPDDFWRAGHWGGWEVLALVLSVLAALLGGLIGIGVGCSFDVRTEQANHTLDTLWHHTASGMLLWTILLLLVLQRQHGREGLGRFVDEVGQWRLSLLTMGTGAAAGAAVGMLLLLTGLLRPGARAPFLPCVLTALPITLPLGYAQFALVPIDSAAWVLVGGATPVALVPLAAHLMRRDRDQRLRFLAEHGELPEPPPAAVEPPSPAVPPGAALHVRPTLASFVGSSAYVLSPALTAGVCTFFLRDTFNTVLWIATGAMFVLAGGMFLSCVFVHLQRLSLDSVGVRVTGPLAAAALRWSEVTSAVLRERVNAVSRADRMLVLQSMRTILTFHTSTLSVADEARVLEFARGKVRLVVQQDRPTV